MDGLKPAANVTRPGAIRSSPGSVAALTPTELPPSRTVTSAADGAPQERYHSPQDGHAQQQGGQPAQSGHDCMIDPEAREVIYREADIRSASPHPNDDALKLRAYRSAHGGEGDAASKALEKSA
jgi:hypothetical protein